MKLIRPILITCALTVSATAFARPFRVEQLPTAPANCATCHVSPGGGGTRNDFGEDVNATLVGGAVDWPAIFALDSDDDGFTNGEELGDPDGTWSMGQPRPTGPTYLPGDDGDFPDCGNGVLDAVNDETCDGADFGGATCESEGFLRGDLACTGGCTIDTTNCTNEPEPDAGPVDTGPTDTGPADGGADAGAPDADGGAGPADTGSGPSDAGATADAGGGPGGGEGDEDDGGCQSVPAASGLLWLGVGFGILARRRRTS